MRNCRERGTEGLNEKVGMKQLTNSTFKLQDQTKEMEKQIESLRHTLQNRRQSDILINRSTVDELKRYVETAKKQTDEMIKLFSNLSRELRPADG